MLISAFYVSRMTGDYAARCRPFLIATLEHLRAGRWWLSWQQRKLHDDDVRAAIAATEGGLAGIPEDDARLREVAEIERTVRRTAPFPHDRTVRQAVQEGGATFLLVTTARSGAAGGWAGVALSGRRLSGFLQSELGPIGQAVPYPLAIADSFGHALWGDAAALNGKASFPLRAVPGWELRAGEPVWDDRRRRFLWYAFVAFLLITLAFGVAVTIRIARREMELAKQKADFAASVTHEFKSPITGIRLLMERITSGRILDPSTIREYYLTVTRETDRLERLVNRLLETHRMQSGRLVYRFAPHCMIDIAQNAIAHLRPQAEAKRIELTLQADDVLREIDLDRTAIQDSIENLIENAIKYSPPETEVVVMIEHGLKDLRVMVRDEGIGIDSADLPLVFDRFYRGRRGEQQAVRGTGLGLPLVKTVAEGHGGAVEVKSAPGRGSEFCLRIPIRQEETYVPSIDRG